MAQLKDLIVNGAARIIGKLYATNIDVSGMITGNLTGNVVGNATTATNLSGFKNDTTISTDIDSMTSNGIWYTSSNAIPGGTATTNNDGMIRVMAYNTNWIVQLYQSFRNNTVWIRTRSNGTWNAWKQITANGDISSHKHTYDKTTSVSAHTYTPAGTVTVTPATTKFNTDASKISNWSAGTAPSVNYNSSNKTLTLSLGSVPSLEYATANSSAVTISSASFSGTQATLSHTLGHTSTDTGTLK